VQLRLSEDQELFRRTVRQFLEREAPLTTVRALTDDPAGFDRGWWRKGAELGWTSMLVPEKHGGGNLSGDGLRDLAIVAEEMGRLVSPGPLLPTSVVLGAIAEATTVEAHTSAIERLLTGDAVAAWYAAVPGATTTVTARPDGDGYRLDGVAEPVEAGSEADYLLVTARTEGGLSQFLVPADADGLRRDGLDGLDLVRRFARLTFDGVHAGQSDLVGSPDAAAEAVEQQLQTALVLQAAETAGAIEKVLDFTIGWAFDRYSFGRPLASYQALKHRFADMKMWVEACHATATAAALAAQQRTPDAAELVSVAKAYIGDRATEIVQDCVQMHGGIGVTWEHDLHLYLRRVTTNRVTYGTPNDHRRRVADLIEAADGSAK
jgi:alkylation response protein AidB-like acyl-CoA dehydrogenase